MKKVKGNFLNLGEYLNEAWQIKKELTREISNSEIDELYFKAILIFP